ncbi:MAG: GTP cyclohydrolase I FolE2 [Betaproteobacteria bacterium HGW-Betaproteobacteria-22]|nr:MAG: GTP cyclohydrolase I FolE2 [Betaproteobacteria bacterium HGW-Betaproteobacteria-22]
MNKPEILHLEDVQNNPDQRQIAINKVGIKGIRHPVTVSDFNNRSQHTIATFNMTVALPSHLKGTHMSRFVEILNRYEHALSIQSMAKMLHDVVSRLEAGTGEIEISFPYFIQKSAPVSGVKSLLDYEASLIAKIQGGQYRQIIKLLVPATSLCPCSKSISAYGAHNQRSHITVTARINNTLYLEELIQLIEKQASSELYGLLKRPDEKFITEHAYDNPKFVEDIVRDVAASLNKDRRIDAYIVECENFESIHNHSAYAQVTQGIL